jgi:hypothetical protein
MSKKLQATPGCDLPDGLSQPAMRALFAVGCYRLEQVVLLREADLLRLHGFGPRAMLILRAALSAQGLAFLPEPDEKK